MICLERLGVWITKNPAIIIVAAILLTLFSVHYAQQIETQGMTTESFVSKSSSLYQLYDHLYQQNFAVDGNIVLIEGDDVAKADVLCAELRLSDHMKTVPHIISIQSIADLVSDAEYESTGVRSIPSQERIDEILASAGASIKGLMPDRKHARMILGMPTTATLNEEQRKELLDEISSAIAFADFPAGYSVIVTGDPSFQAAIVKLMNSSKELLDEISSAIAFADFPAGYSVIVTGDPSFQAAIVKLMNSSNGSVLLLCGALMIVALLLVFSHVRWSLLPLPIVLLGIIWTFGAMGFLNIPMSMVTFAAFPIMIGIGIDYAIQFHNRIDEELMKGRNILQASIHTVGHVALPVIIAMIITEAGFISLLSSSVPSIRDFGKVCIIGLIMCYLSALFVNVTIIYVFEGRYPRKRDPKRSSEEGSAIGSFIEKTADFCVERWKPVLAVALIFALAGNYADMQAGIETNSQNYIPQDLSPLIDLRHMKEVFGGTDAIQFVVQADDITDPENLKWMDDFGNYLLDFREDRTESVTSIATYIKAANGGVLPDDRTRIREIVDALPISVRDSYLSGHNLALIDANIGDVQANLGAEGMKRLIQSYDEDLAWMTPPPGVSVRTTGKQVVMTTVMDALTFGRVEMSLLGLVMIFVLLLIIYRDLIKALLPVLPMLVVIGWMGLVMYYGGIKYTPLTATLGALILGVGSEYAIMMMERFYEELANVGNPHDAMKIAANRIGSALMASGATTVFGFAALISSPFNIISNFGLVTVLSVLLALIITFTVFMVLLIRMEAQREVIENSRRDLRKSIALIESKSWRRSNGN